MDFWKKKSKKFEKIRKYIPIVLKNNKKKISKKLCIQDRPKRTSGIYLLFFSAQNKPNSMDFWKIFWFFEKSTKKNCPVWGQNQKNGDFSAPDGQNFNRFFLSDSTSKNTSKKVGDKKFWHTPTQFFVIFDFWPSSGGARFFGPWKW